MAPQAKLIERLRDTHRLDTEGYKSILEDEDPQNMMVLCSEARKTAVSVFGHKVFIRGLIEISNHCRNNCFYCGIRAANGGIKRYRLSKDDIMGCCRTGYDLGFRTFVLQGGEDPVQDDDWVEDVVRSIRSCYPDCAITLSIGEKSPGALRRFKEAGADRYLLRHETFNPEHYALLHPVGMSRDKRLECLHKLKETGYQTGSGIMVGSPFQSIDNLVEDILFIQELDPEMIGLGPFIHHCGTPFAAFPDGSVTMTLKLISIFRLISPKALIPATTSLATLDPEGRCKGILSGANVVMPNLSPSSFRKDYSLYEGKASSGCEGAEGLEMLRQELHAIGYDIWTGRGDYDNLKTLN